MWASVGVKDLFDKCITLSACPSADHQPRNVPCDRPGADILKVVPQQPLVGTENVAKTRSPWRACAGCGESNTRRVSSCRLARSDSMSVDESQGAGCSSSRRGHRPRADRADPAPAGRAVRGEGAPLGLLRDPARVPPAPGGGGAAPAHRAGHRAVHPLLGPRRVCAALLGLRRHGRRRPHRSRAGTGGAADHGDQHARRAAQRRCCSPTARKGSLRVAP